jgi:hypothetical protein
MDSLYVREHFSSKSRDNFFRELSAVDNLLTPNKASPVFQSESPSDSPELQPPSGFRMDRRNSNVASQMESSSLQAIAHNTVGSVAGLFPSK